MVVTSIIGVAPGPAVSTARYSMTRSRYGGESQSAPAATAGLQKRPV